MTTLFSDDNGSLRIHTSDEGTDKYLVGGEIKGDIVAAWKVPVFERSEIGKMSPGSVCELLRD